ncbi:MAG TPA: (d)CMP kinase [Deltaproteobacteria bacterium]|nr:(d)CMP kinase [Deltaproteobacteria bacterium]
MKHRAITIDGPAGSGKSSVAREVALRLGFSFLDTGALYRAAALAIRDAGCDANDNDACGRVLQGIHISQDGGTTLLNGRDVSQEIRTPETSALASAIAVHPSVRGVLVEVQRSFLSRSSLVAEGRDTGSVVFPDADVKIYLHADPEERARRRHAELVAKGMSPAMETVLHEMKIRDERDEGRKESPLVIPESAVVVDTTHLNIQEVVEKILSLVRERLTD